MATHPGGSGPDERRRRLAQATAARASRHRSRGLVWIGVGVAVSAIPFAVLCVLWLNGVDPGGWLNVIGSFCGLLTISLVAFGRRYLAAGAETVLAEDERAPIVYLRPFDTDRAEVAAPWRSRQRISPLATVEPTYEQRLARTLRKVGPFVAFGDPSERLPQLGAARVYSTDEDWQAKVDELTARAGVVLLHAGESEGITWEVRHVVAMNDPDRVILSLPVQAKRNRPSRQERYDTFRRLFGDAFPQTLPEHIGESQFLYFEGDWTPRLLEGRAASPPARGGEPGLALQRLAREFKITWAPLWIRSPVYVAALFALPTVLSIL
jgi:hypothetical protein